MEIESGQIRLKLKDKNLTSSVIYSPNAKGDIFIPKFVEYDTKKYIIIKLGEKAFQKADIESLTFADDSEVKIFKKGSFESTNIRKLQIPAKLETLEDLWFRGFKNLVEIEVSPENKNFIYFDHKYLLGKSDKNSEKFDALYLARCDIKEAVIPSHIKILKPYCLNRHIKLDSVIFPDNSELKCIEKGAIGKTRIKKLVLPASVEDIDSSNFGFNNYLFDLKISPKNKIFLYVDNKYLVKRNDKNSSTYDILVFIRRDIKEFLIPSHIKVIDGFAFNWSTKLKSIKFEDNSSLEIIKDSAFCHMPGPEKLCIPKSIKEIGICVFLMDNLKIIEFLGENIKIGVQSIYSCPNLQTISFPNIKKLTLGSRCFPDNAKIYVKKGVELFGTYAYQNKDKFIYIDNKNEMQNQGETKEKIQTNDKNKEKSQTNDKNKEKCIVNDKNKEKIHINDDVINKNDRLMNHIRFLESHLSKYEKIDPFDPDSNEKIDHEIRDQTKKEENIFIDSEDEKQQKIISKIGEGTSSVAYKVVDLKTSKVMCKKVLKVDEGKTTFKDFQNIMKEFEVLNKINHPSICKAIGINTQEKILTDQNNGAESKATTTIAIFTEFLNYKLSDCLKNGILNNTLKSRIALEVAFGMKHIHQLNMMHRDLKIENIMLNCIFEAKIIDFELASVKDQLELNTSLTKGIGTFKYMSPEMLCEKEYDNKTDVYSYGVVLFVLFTGNLPKQSIDERISNKQCKFPNPSSSISQCCINLIKKCMSFDPKNRPSFKDIIEYMEKNSFMMADEIDTGIVRKRYQELNCFEVGNFKTLEKLKK